MRTFGPEYSDTQESLSALADALIRMGRYDEAAKLYLDTVHTISLLPKGDTSITLYNLACVTALAGRRNDAFNYLFRAIQSGFDDVKDLREDDDLKSLRKDPRFAQAVAQTAAKARPQ
jgi:Flp pilus assembly protein TadD